MKKLFLFCMLFICSISILTAQVIEHPERLKESDSRDRLVLELNHTRWLETPAPLAQKWYGRGINIHFFYDFKMGKSRNFSIAPGAGLSCHNVYHNGKLSIDTLGGKNISYFAARDTSLDYKINKLNSNWLEIPIELRFRSNPGKNDRSIKFALGIRGGLLLSAKTKYRGEGNVNGLVTTVREKQNKLLNISKYRFGPSVRIGYGEVSIVGFYSLTGLFQTDKGPDLKAISIGVSFNSF